VWNLLHAIVRASGILWWLLDFLKIRAPLIEVVL